MAMSRGAKAATVIMVSLVVIISALAYMNYAGTFNTNPTNGTFGNNLTGSVTLPDVNVGNNNQTNQNSTNGGNGNDNPNSNVSYKLSLMVPLYTSNPTEDWSMLTDVKEEHPNLVIYAVVNRNSGPGDFSESFKNGVEDMQDAGIVVLGYIWTDYGRISSSQIESQIDLWKDQYDVDGVMFSGMSYPGCGCPGTPEHYEALASYAENAGMEVVVGDTGSTADMSDYVEFIDVINVYTNQGLPETSQVEKYPDISPQEKWSVIAYNVPEEDVTEEYIDSISDFVGFVYFTSESGGNPWINVTPYLENLIELLKIEE